MYLLLLCELGLQRLDADVSRLVHQLAELDAHHLREPDGGVVDLVEAERVEGVVVILVHIQQHEAAVHLLDVLFAQLQRGWRRR